MLRYVDVCIGIVFGNSRDNHFLWKFSWKILLTFWFDSYIYLFIYLFSEVEWEHRIQITHLSSFHTATAIWSFLICLSESFLLLKFRNSLFINYQIKSTFAFPFFFLLGTIHFYNLCLKLFKVTFRQEFDFWRMSLPLITALIFRIIIPGTSDLLDSSSFIICAFEFPLDGELHHFYYYFF